MLRWASGGTWLAVAVLLLVALWGWLDPFGIRQRLDWMVSDQFLRHRTPPAVHKDLLQISVDDSTVAKLGFPVPRHYYARALRQLQSLGARTIVMDILFIDPDNELALDPDDRVLIQHAPVVSESLRADLARDRILAGAMSKVDRLVLPFHFPPPLRVDPTEEHDIHAISARLSENPSLKSDDITEQMNIPTERVSRLFELALKEALSRVARGLLQSDPALPADEAIARVEAIAALSEVRKRQFLRAFDLCQSTALIEQKNSLQGVIPLGHLDHLDAHTELQLPVYLLAAPAHSLGFANAGSDGDGRLRQVPLVKGWGDRAIFYMALVAALAHQDARPDQLEFDSGGVHARSSPLRVPLDSRGFMVINWPMNERRPWDRVIPQLPLGLFVDLDRYEYDLASDCDRLRELVARTDTLTGSEDWRSTYEIINQYYKEGELESAHRKERTFDENGIPQVLGRDKVREALEKVRTEPAPQDPSSEGELLKLARAIFEVQQEIERLKREYQRESDKWREKVAGKLCLIGDTTTGSSDFRQTPVGNDVPGVSVIASAVNTLLTGNYATVYRYPVSALLMAVVGIGLLWPFLRLRPVAAGACGSVGMLGTLYGSYALLATADVMISPVTPIAGLVALYLATTTYQWLSEYRQKKLVRSIFEAQTNPTIVERLIEAGQAGVEEVLKPKNRQVTVLFAEIADFEGLAQQVAPERLPEILGRVFGTMNKLIQAHEGTLDRYQGHAMVAFFGAPVYQPDHAQRACRAALECCDTLRGMESAWKERGLPAPRIEIGLHTGELLVGNITLTSRVDYTVAGENLNVAYRIGELNETYGTQIMISEPTLTRCENMVEARELDLVRIKGRREPIRAYELMSAKGRLSLDQSQLRGTFATGLVAFRNKDYAGALAMFRTCRETSPGDRPVTVYIERCEKEIAATVQVASSGAASV